MSKCARVLSPVTIGGQRIPSIPDGDLGDVAAATLSAGLGLTSTGRFFCLRLDLRFLAIGFLIKLLVVGKVTRSSYRWHLTTEDLILTVDPSGDFIQIDKRKIEFMLPALVEIVSQGGFFK